MAAATHAVRHLTVLGARGRVGRRVVAEALDRGHTVTAVLRDPRQAQEVDPRASVAIADALDPAQVRALATRTDVVVHAARPSDGSQEAMARLTRSILHGVSSTEARLVVVGGAATLKVPDQPDLTVLDDPRYLPAAWRPVGMASATQQALCEALDHTRWTYLCPPADLAPGVRTGRYRLGTDTLLVDDKGRAWISMEDLAVALVDEVEQERHPGQRFTVAAT